MIVNSGHLIRVQFGGEMTTAARAIFVGEDKHLIHAGVESVRAEGLRQLVDQVEHDFVNFRMQGAITAAINPGVARIFSGGFVEFRMRAQQAIGYFVPGLVAQQVDLRYHADPGRFRRRDDRRHIVT